MLNHPVLKILAASSRFKRVVSLSGGWQYQPGLSLLETVVATGIALLLLITLVAGAAVSVRNATVARNRSRAEKLVREEIERVRGFRDQQTFAALDPSLCIVGSTNYCYLTSALTLQSGTGDAAKEVVGNFRRYFQLASPGGCPAAASGVKEVVVVVEWSEGRGTGPGGAGIHQATVRSCFTNWRAIATPGP